MWIQKAASPVLLSTCVSAEVNKLVMRAWKESAAHPVDHLCPLCFDKIDVALVVWMLCGIRVFKEGDFLGDTVWSRMLLEKRFFV